MPPPGPITEGSPTVQKEAALDVAVPGERPAWDGTAATIPPINTSLATMVVNPPRPLANTTHSFARGQRLGLK